MPHGFLIFLIPFAGLLAALLVRRWIARVQERRAVGRAATNGMGMKAAQYGVDQLANCESVHVAFGSTPPALVERGEI